MPSLRSEEHTSELQSHSDLHSFPTRRSSDLLGEAGAIDALTGDEGRPAGRAGLLAIAVGEQHALLGEPIDVRGAVAHQPVRVAAQIRLADVVAPDDEDVGFFRLCHCSLLSGCSRRASCAHPRGYEATEYHDDRV